MLNPEKIWHANLTDLSTSPVTCSHFTLGNQNFWQSYSKNKKMNFFAWTQGMYNWYIVTNKCLIWLLTGSGLGRLMAERFARLGCKLILWDINSEWINKVAAELRQLDVEVHTYTCDVANSDSVYQTANKVCIVYTFMTVYKLWLLSTTTTTAPI